MTEEERQEWIKKINDMSHVQMARTYRFSPAGHPIFHEPNDLYRVFMDRFQSFGGMTPCISKTIGW